MNPYKNRPSDTPDYIRDMQIAIVLKKSPLERLRMCTDMADFSMAMVRKQIKDKHPEISEGELKFETIKAVYADCYNEEEMNRIKAHFMGLSSTSNKQ
jgi:hypothetical protein